MIGRRLIRFARFVPSAFLRIPQALGIRKIVQVAVPGLCLLLTACGGNMENPNIELNAHPKMHYAVAITVAGAPGPFDAIKASAEYEVANRGCVPLQAISGVTVLPRKRIDLNLRQNDEGSYETDLYIDLLKDNDYFGKGVCHWSLVAVSARADRNATKFVTPLFTPDFFEKEGTTRYFSHAAYSDSQNRSLDTGDVNRNVYPDPSRVFSIRVVAKEIAQ